MMIYLIINYMIEVQQHKVVDIIICEEKGGTMLNQQQFKDKYERKQQNIGVSEVSEAY